MRPNVYFDSLNLKNEAAVVPVGCLLARCSFTEETLQRPALGLNRVMIVDTDIKKANR